MKKKLIILSVITLLSISLLAQKETKKSSFGFGIEMGAPTGSYTNLYTFEAGLTIRYSYHAGPGFVTLTTGTLGLFPKKIVGQSEKVGLQIPIRAGYKYIFDHHYFVMGELGYVSTKTYYGAQGKVLSTSQGSFLTAPSVGVQFNAFEISLRYEAHPGNGGGIAGLRIGFNF